MLLRESNTGNAKYTAAPGPSSSSNTPERCLIGSWRQTVTEFNVTGELLGLPEDQHDKKIRVKGPTTTGSRSKYQTDGRLSIDFEGVENEATGPAGQKIRLVYAGKANYRFTVKDNKMHYTGIDSTETVDIYVDDKLIKGYDLAPLLDPSSFTCNDDVMHKQSEDGSSFSTHERVKE